jgi:hypothetical protein
MATKSATSATALLLALFTLAAVSAAHAQTATESPKPVPTRSESTSWPIHTFFLKTNDQATTGEITGALRNALPPGTSVSSIYSENAIVIRLNPADIPTVETILNDLDRPRKTYRVTYTLSEMDNNKRIGTQHFAVVMVSGQRAKFDQGSKVPISSGSGPATQFTYADVDLTVIATLQDIGSGGSLQYDLEQASVASPPADAPPQPLMRHTSLTGEAYLTPGKPLVLGSIDFPGSTRRLDVEALMEPLP